MRLLLAAIRCEKDAIGANLLRHLAVLDDARAIGADFALFPELSLTGSLPGTSVLIDHPAVANLVEATRHGPGAVFGVAERGPDAAWITQIVAERGSIGAVHRKAHLGEGEEGQYRSGTPAGVFVVAGIRCSMAVCAEIGTPVPYDRDAALVLGPAAPGLYGPLRDPTDAEGWRRGFDWWRGQCLADARRLAVPRRRWLAIATQAGATFDEDFPGWAALIGPDGDVVAESADHREALLAVEVPLPDA